MTKSCRGYISSRSFGGNWAPQHIQNTIIRHYCQTKGLYFLLSAAEYAIEDCYMVLADLVKESEKLTGIVLYSMHQLPSNKELRNRFCNKILDNKCVIHLSVENTEVRNQSDLSDLNVIMDIHKVLPKCLQSVHS